MTPTVTRRGLLQAGGLASAAAFVGARPWTADAATAGSPLQRSTYTSLRSRDFDVGGVPLKLQSVLDVPAAATVKALRGSEEVFSLVFAGPLAPKLDSGIHDFRHRELGAFKLFISPIDVPDGKRLYEVVVVSRPQPKRIRPPRRRRPRGRRPVARVRAAVVKRVWIRRVKRGVRVKLGLSEKVHVKTVAAWLMRGDRVVASGVRKRVRGRRRVSVRLHSRRRVRRGRYHLVVQTRDRRGRDAWKRQRVRVR